MAEPRPPEEPIIGLSSYNVRESRRARNVVLKVSVRGELEIVIPSNFDRKKIPGILRRREGWIEKTVKRYREQGKLGEPGSPAVLPDRISLKAIEEDWRVEYCQTSTMRAMAIEKESIHLTVRGNVENVNACRSALRRWIEYKAYVHLIPWLRKMSEEEGLLFVRASVRGQRTRWGSCSRERAISINQKLLFLPEHLVRYVFLHELCHTVHLNHSSTFWGSLKEREPLYKKLNTELRSAWRFVPPWAD